jgi:hypothetical protein
MVQSENRCGELVPGYLPYCLDSKIHTYPKVLRNGNGYWLLLVSTNTFRLWKIDSVYLGGFSFLFGPFVFTYYTP